MTALNDERYYSKCTDIEYDVEGDVLSYSACNKNASSKIDSLDEQTSVPCLKKDETNPKISILKSNAPDNSIQDNADNRLGNPKTKKLIFIQESIYLNIIDKLSAKVIKNGLKNVATLPLPLLSPKTRKSFLLR